MAFAKITNGVVTYFPYSIGQLRKAHANVSFPKSIPDELLAQYDMYPVAIQDTPTVDTLTHRVVADSMPTLVGGEWLLAKSTVALSQDEITKQADVAATRIRSVRTKLLTDSDWTQLADALVDSTAWATYRQALRDITGHANFPYLTVADWPVKP